MTGESQLSYPLKVGEAMRQRLTQLTLCPESAAPYIRAYFSAFSLGTAAESCFIAR